MENLKVNNLDDKIYIYFTNVINCENKCNTKGLELLPSLYKKSFEMRFNSPLRYYSLGPCHVHRKHSYGIKPDGTIVKCLTQTKKLMDIKEDKNFTYESKSLLLDKCKKCEFLPICYGGCKYEYPDIEENCPLTIFKELLPMFIKLHVDVYKNSIE